MKKIESGTVQPRPNRLQGRFTRVAAAAGLLALVIPTAGCGTFRADKQTKVSECTDEVTATSTYNEHLRTGQPVLDSLGVTMLTDQANTNANNLYKRILAIKRPYVSNLSSANSVNDVTLELSSNGKKFDLTYPSINGNGFGSKIRFKVENGAVAPVAVGAVTCIEGNQVYANGTSFVLQALAQETTQFDGLVR